MVQIDKSKPVLVTGASGYVAGWIIYKLLEQGITVHATVRNKNQTDKIQHLLDAQAKLGGKLEFFNADLLKNGSFAEAMQGCELVFHTASPFTSNYKDPQKELIDPALLGTKNVLVQANSIPSVKRIVLTSSCAAIYSDSADLAKTKTGAFTEEDWNTTSSLEHIPYSYSKTLAEQEAWRIAGMQTGWDLVVINPSFVLGPPLNPLTATSESIALMQQFTNRSLSFGVPNIEMGAVDVRDLAAAHISAGYTPEAKGRNIISGKNTSFLEMGQLLKAMFPERVKFRASYLPKWLLGLVGSMVNPALTKRFVKQNVGWPWKADNTKGIRELGASYRPLDETLRDMFTVLIDSKRF